MGVIARFWGRLTCWLREKSGKPQRDAAESRHAGGVQTVEHRGKVLRRVVWRRARLSFIFTRSWWGSMNTGITHRRPKPRAYILPLPVNITNASERGRTGWRPYVYHV